MLPETLKSHIQENLHESVLSARRVTGGSINQAARVELSSSGRCFLKWNTTDDPDMFAKEKMGLQLLARAQTGLVIPHVIMTGSLSNGTGFLLQEYIDEGRPRDNSAESFGNALAQLHNNHAELYGLDYNNYIGSLPQYNNQHSDWTSFFVDERMEPQLEMALNSGKLDSSTAAAFKNMYKLLPDIFPDEPPSLLHGDLWGGNYFYDSEGQAAIYDPAAYYGHREIEIAFTRLFGGFSEDFYRSYETAYPMEPGFEERKDIYNLYPLLVHTNLFGGSYARQVESIVRRFK